MPKPSVLPVPSDMQCMTFTVNYKCFDFYTFVLLNFSSNDFLPYDDDVDDDDDYYYY